MTDKPKRQMIIAGKNGAGKSTVKNLLLQEFPTYEEYATGDFMRTIGVERGMTLEELHKIAKDDPSIDETVDNMTRGLQDKEEFILDSRIGFHFLPDAFSVFLSCPEEIAAERIVNNAHLKEQRIGHVLGTVEEETEKLKKRHDDDRERYRKFYGIEDHLDPKNFDLVIDTSEIGPEEVRDMILEGYEKFLG